MEFISRGTEIILTDKEEDFLKKELHILSNKLISKPRLRFQQYLPYQVLQ